VVCSGILPARPIDLATLVFISFSSTPTACTEAT